MIFQFVLSAAFIVGILVVYKQINFIQHQQLGYNKDNVVSIDMPLTTIDEMVKNTQRFQQDARNIPGIVSVSGMDHSNMVDDFGKTGDIQWKGQDPKNNIGFGNIGMNDGLIETMGKPPVAG